MNSYYAHAKLGSGKVTSINRRPEPAEGFVAIEIDTDFAISVMTGHESLHKFQVALVDGKYQLQRKPVVRSERRTRTELLQLVEVPIQPAQPVDVDLLHGGRVVAVVDRTSAELEIFYNGEYLKRLDRPIKVYATREGDPSYLKCTLSIGVNILNEIAEKNALETWPNPLRVRLADGTDDLTFFAHANSGVLAFEKA